MEMPGRCEACGEERMVLDEIHGVLACDACGRMGNQDETELRAEWQTGHLIERRGTFVRESDDGVSAARGLMRGHNSHSFHSDHLQSNERYRFETMKKVESITALLRVPADKVYEAKHLLESTLDGDWGTGRWVDILVAACVYVVIRQSQLPLTVPEVADCVNCDVIELGRMYNRILQKLEINLPNVNASVFLERAASSLPAMTKVSKEKVRTMKKQGTLLLDYAQDCCIMTGRRPLPVVAAVLSLVLEVNKVVVEIAEVARELHAGLWATKKRYKECQTALIGIGQSLPWGKDINLKNIPRHLPFLLQYLELKNKLEKKKKGQTLSGTVTCPASEERPRTPVKSMTRRLPKLSDDQLQLAVPETSVGSYGSALSGRTLIETCVGDGDMVTSRDDPQTNAVSEDSFAPLWQERPTKFLKMTGLSDNEDNLCSVNDDLESVEGMPEATQSNSATQDGAANAGLQMISGRILKEVKWEGLPAAFCASLEARTRRRLKIDLAKNRIFEARKALTIRFGKASYSLDSPVSAQNVQGQFLSDAELSDNPNKILDWEDLIIEHLILSGASEAEVENGYYRSLLAVYPEQSVLNLEDDDPASYLRSRSEVELLLDLRGR